MTLNFKLPSYNYLQFLGHDKIKLQTDTRNMLPSTYTYEIGILKYYIER